MKIHEQRDALAKAMELAIWALPDGPTLSAFGIAREDCALVHIDYVGGVHSVGSVLANALAEVRGTTTADEWAAHRRRPAPSCDNACCAPAEEAKATREQHRASYTNVAAWVDETA